MPLLGPHLSTSKVLVAGGYTGHGVALSVRAGQLIARAIAEGKPLPIGEHSLANSCGSIPACHSSVQRLREEVGHRVAGHVVETMAAMVSLRWDIEHEALGPMRLPRQALDLAQGMRASLAPC